MNFKFASTNVLFFFVHLTQFDFEEKRLDRLVSDEKEASLQRAVWRNGGGKCGFER
jgi:hypothetical protein